MKRITYLLFVFIFSLNITVIADSSEGGTQDNSNIVKSDINASDNSIADIYYVINDTTVNGDGSYENPYGGLPEAVKAIREITGSEMTGDITVYLRGGRYSLLETLEFTEEDSGKNGYKITYESYPGETAEITATKEISRWEQYRDGIYMTKLARGEVFNMLFENDTMAHKARYPNVGEVFREGYLNAARTPQINPSRTIMFQAGQIPYLYDTTGLQAFYFAGGKNGVYNWFSNLYNAQIDYRDNEISMSSDSTNNYVIGAGSRYFLQGCLEFLDAEGEFYLDKQFDTLYYKPYNEDIDNQVIGYSSEQTIISFKGAEGKNVENINLKRLKIGKTNSSEQIYSEVCHAILFQNAKHCGIMDSEILLTGGTAIFARTSSTYLTFSGNYIHDIGGEGIYIRASDQLPDNTIDGYNTITNNYITNVGLRQAHSGGIHIRSSDYNTVTHNLIKNVPRFGIQFSTGNLAPRRVGKIYDGVTVTEENMYDLTSCRGNYFGFNDISNCMIDTQDGGPIYTWGAGKNNIIDNNYVHNSNIHFSMGYGVYIDDATGYTTIKNNIVESLQQEGNGNLNAALMMKSREHMVFNNFFLNNNTTNCAITTETKHADEQKDIVFIKNIVSNSGEALHGQWAWMSDRFRKCNFNLYYNDSGKYLLYNNAYARTYDEWKRLETDYGYLDTDSIHDELPLFVNEDELDFRLRYDSPAYRLGIQDVDMANIGLNSDFIYANKDDIIDRLYLSTTIGGASANVRLSVSQSTEINSLVRTKTGFIADMEDVKITYASNNPSIATVDDKGVITARAEGLANIIVTVSRDEVVLSKDIFVLVDDALDKIELKSLDDILINGTETELSVIALSTSGYVIPGLEVTYSSSNNNIAQVNSEGVVLTKGIGEVKLIATVQHRGELKSSSVSLKVVEALLDTVSLTAEKFDGLIPGEKIQLEYEAVMTNESLVNTETVEKEFSVEDESIITINQQGELTAVGAGRTKAILRMTKDGFSKNGELDVVVYEKESGFLPEGWKETNFGTSHGYADFIDNKVTIMSTGRDFFGKEDDGYYLYREIKDNKNVIITAEISSLYNTNTNAAIGVSIRETAEADSQNVTIRIRPNGQALAVWRAEKGGSSSYMSFGEVSFPCKLRLEKNGDIITLSYSDGVEWKVAHTLQMTFSSDYTVGVPVFAQSELSTEAVINLLNIEER